ncbi:hypothetical protein [Streptomyces mirabilis]|uniref:hypothetical protein n=1 Tax=Streptomyces mirabilis TaxID=68239 RepID=UPI0036DE1FCF
MATKIDGTKIARDIRSRVAQEVASSVASGAGVPGLATILVGDDPVGIVVVGHRGGRLTPVPGCVGPMTIAPLMVNTQRGAAWAKHSA